MLILDKESWTKNPKISSLSLGFMFPFQTHGRGVWITPVKTGRKLNVSKTFRRRPGHLLNILCTFSLRPVSTGTL